MTEIEVYDKEKNCLIIGDQKDLSIEEKVCILACRSGNPSENSFAAEILFHAEMAEIHRKDENAYKSAIKADLSVCENNSFIEQFIEYNFKHPDVSYVRLQRRLHGER